ncbi:MAG: Hsp33 family molecular chaperone HslO [Anaerorhabdus sp.]
MNDILVKAIALNGKVKLVCTITTELCNRARMQHDLMPTSLAALGRVMSAGVMMAANLKGKDEKINIQINGGGPLGTCMVECKSNGDVKGFVGNNEIYLKYNDSNKLAVGLAVGSDGYLQVIKDMGLSNTFSSKVLLQTGEIGDDFAYYYSVSEQTPTAISVGVLVDTDTTCLASGGLLIQLMPDANEDDILKVEEVVSKLDPISSLINGGSSASDILLSLFDDTKILEKNDIRWHCDCSKDKFKASLTTLSRNDIVEIIEEDGGCEVKCEFCNTAYNISKEELEAILEFKGRCGR